MGWSAAVHALHRLWVFKKVAAGMLGVATAAVPVVQEISGLMAIITTHNS